MAMALNSHVQKRNKHLDLSLLRETEFIERQYEQNLIIYKKFEQIVRHDMKQIPVCTRRIDWIPLDEVHNEENPITNQHKKRMHMNDDPIEKSDIPIDNFNHGPHQLNGQPSQPVRKYRRLCLKGDRLPPIVTSHGTNREKRANKPVRRMTTFQQSNIENENANHIFAALNQKLSKRTERETSHVRTKIHSFLDTLPTYEGARKGFDNFAPSALYSTRATVAMR
jgi:hypothetical protein